MKPLMVSTIALSLLVSVAALPSEAAPPAVELVEPAPQSSVCTPPEQPAPQFQAGSNWTFEGCFAYFSAGPCFDVFRDGSGTLWICKACGTTTKPGRGQCQVLTASGFWCS